MDDIEFLKNGVFRLMLMEKLRANVPEMAFELVDNDGIFLRLDDDGDLKWLSCSENKSEQERGGEIEQADKRIAELEGKLEKMLLLVIRAHNYPQLTLEELKRESDDILGENDNED
jgi:hypothetical protein